MADDARQDPPLHDALLECLAEWLRPLTAADGDGYVGRASVFRTSLGSDPWRLVPQALALGRLGLCPPQVCEAVADVVFAVHPAGMTTIPEVEDLFTMVDLLGGGANGSVCARTVLIICDKCTLVFDRGAVAVPLGTGRCSADTSLLAETGVLPRCTPKLYEDLVPLTEAREAQHIRDLLMPHGVRLRVLPVDA